ncbi:uncharacterized protein CG1161 [Episyrphus balteatus]|uniref:uncharacterized protein CG1161 n=1 Tax=Episyrphus balteatus TaxID=286459 RepID=UPI002484F699|nr:uncharacterized protein CG1161 [Episyrphus balteatus]XP_055842106.1 uncharacterized protein CG1161 [Episyrphus balteatus]
MDSKQLKRFFVISVIFFVFALGYASSAQAEVATQNASTPEPPNEPKQKCVCDGALLPTLGENGKEIEICPHCKCKYENRNTTLIKVVVIIVIWIISILVIYMLFLMCLDPLLNKRVKANYQEHTNEDDDTTSVSPQTLPNNAAQELNARANVLNRVGHQQDKWKKQVREQRRHIYDRRTMLN